MRPLGYQPDHPDSRDWDFALLAKEKAREKVFPTRYTQRPYIPGKPFEQGPIGSCVAQAGFRAINIRHRVDGVEEPEIGSRLFGYYMIRGYIGTTRWDSGGHIRNFFRGLNDYGFVPEKEYPYRVGKFAKKPPDSLMMGSFDQRNPSKYWRIKSEGNFRVNDLEASLSLNWPVVFGADLPRSFFDVDTRDPVQAGNPDDVVGGHAMCAIGYGPDGLEIINSWGEDWGDEGYAILSWDFVKERCRDFWVVEHAPYFSSESR